MHQNMPFQVKNYSTHPSPPSSLPDVHLRPPLNSSQISPVEHFGARCNANEPNAGKNAANYTENVTWNFRREILDI